MVALRPYDHERRPLELDVHDAVSGRTLLRCAGATAATALLWASVSLPPQPRRPPAESAGGRRGPPPALDPGSRQTTSVRRRRHTTTWQKAEPF